MKSLLRKIIRFLATLPLIGRFIRIAVAIYRLPEFRAEQLEINPRICRRFANIKRVQLPALQDSIAQLSNNQAAFIDTLQQYRSAFDAQYAPLLENISELNNSLLRIDSDQENLVKSVPVALRRISRAQHEIDERLQHLRARIDDLGHSTKDQLANTSQLLDNLAQSVTYLEGRAEFIRRELMFEMRYGASHKTAESERLEAQTRVISPEKLAAARSGQLRINLGCGNIPLDGYINIDRRALPGVDIVAEIDAMPFDKEEVDEIYSSHVMEHFPQEQLRRELLPYWHNLLKPGGKFHAVVPDAEAMIREYSQGQYPYDDLREVIYGGQDYDGDFHFNMFTPDSVSQLLHEAGFKDVHVVESGRRNGACYECEVAAVRKS